MSINNLNTYLNVRDAHLRVVSGNVYAQAMNIGGINVETAHGLQSVSDTGNVTSNTLQFSNATTGFITTANAQIGRDLVVTGNATVSTDLTVSANATVTDTLTISEHLIASKEATVTGNLHVTTIRSDSNVVAEYTGPHDRPLREYPEIAMTTASGTSSGYKGYKVSTSSQLSGYEGYKAFDKTGWETPWLENNNAWVSGGSKYVAGTGLPDTGAFTTSYVGGTATGEYIQLQLPRKIKISKYDYTPRTHTGNDEGKGAPKTVKLLGSNDDGSTWTLIKDITHMGTRPEEGVFYTARVDATEYYDYIRFVATSTYTDGTSPTFTDVRLSQIRFYGYEEGSGSLDTTLKTVYNVPATTGTQLEVYYDGQDYSTGVTVNDLSPNTNNGTLNGGVGFDSTYKAFTFSASSNQYISTSTSISGNYVHSMSMWFKPTGLTSGSGDTLVYVGDEVDHSKKIEVFVESDRINYTFRGNDYQAYPQFLNNVWHHLTVTYNGQVGESGREIYLNGKKLQGTHSGNSSALVISNNNLELGRYTPDGTSSTTYHFDGSIANFRLYSKVLNAEQIQELYDYQKDYFLGSKSQLTIYKGHLGVGVTEPSGQLELAGDERIQEYPPRAITVLNYHTHIEGHGEFEFSSNPSNYTGSTDWDLTKAFENTERAGVGWHGNSTSAPGAYQAVLQYAPAVTSGDGLVKSILKDGSTIFGEWIQMHSPYAINVTRLATAPRTNYGNSRGIGIFAILGSNNGIDWEYAGDGAIAPYNPSSSTDAGGYGTRTSETIAHVSTNSNGHYYTYHRLVVTHIMGHRGASGHPNYSSGGSESVNQSYIRFYGTPGPTTLDKGSLTLGRSLDVPRISRYDVDTETPRPEKLLIDYDTTVNSSLTDISGKGNHGTFFDDAHWSAADKAFEFDGTDDYTATDITITGGNMAWTQSMWFKINAFPASSSTYAILSFFGNKSSLSGQLMSYRNNEFWQDWYGNGVKANYTLEAGKWYHVVSIYHGNTSTDANVRSSIYINGVKQTLTWYSQTSSQMTLPTSTSYELADYINSSNIRHNGWISNPKLYNVALEPSEIKKLYNLGRTGRSMVIGDTAVGIGKAPEAQLDVRGTGGFDAIKVGIPKRGDGHTASLGRIVVAVPIGAPDRNFSSGSVYTGIRVVGTDATNNLLMGVGDSSYSYEPWIQAAYDNSTASVQDFGNKTLRLQPRGGATTTNGSTVTSDDRVKVDEKYIVNATETLMKLKPQTYTRYAAMLDKSRPDLDSWKRYEAGLVTQEVYYDAPELRHIVNMSDDADVSGEDIKTSDDPSVDPDYRNWGSSVSSLDYTQLIPYLIKSNQELYAEIQTLEHKDHTQELRAENNRLKNKVTILENRQTHFNTLLVDVIGRIEKLERPI